jgi:hypothetical protein
MATNRGAEHGAAEDGNSNDATWDADGSLFTADLMGTGQRPDEYTWPDGFAVAAEQSTI